MAQLWGNYRRVRKRGEEEDQEREEGIEKKNSEFGDGV